MTTIHLFINTLGPHQEVVTYMLCQQSTRANHVVYLLEPHHEVVIYMLCQQSTIANHVVDLVCNTWTQDDIGEFVAR